MPAPQLQGTHQPGAVPPGVASRFLWLLAGKTTCGKVSTRRFPVGVNTTFYFQDNALGVAHLKFIERGHTFEPEHMEPFDRPLFEKWCEVQRHVVIHPKAGDCVVFFSHMPHQGVKEDDNVERSNVVCHYQLTPMHEGTWFVSTARGYQGTFPFAQEGRPPESQPRFRR